MQMAFRNLNTGEISKFGCFRRLILVLDDRSSIVAICVLRHGQKDLARKCIPMPGKFAGETSYAAKKIDFPRSSATRRVSTTVWLLLPALGIVKQC